VAGSTGSRPDGTIPEGAGAQARLALDITKAALHEAGASISDVVMARSYVVDIDEWKQVADALRERSDAVRPGMTMIEVSRLMALEHRVEIEVEAEVSSGDE
jgi:enamine deaminase RidA (YjgF/YER057c/UK114 family)